MSKSNKNTGSPKPVHHPGTRKGEEIKKTQGQEEGRADIGGTGASRPAGKSTARDSTSVNPKSAQTKTPGSNQMPPA